MSENTQNIDNTEKVEAEAAPTEKSPEVLLTEKLAHSEEKYKYLYADFENFKKRAIKERQDAMKFGWENVAGDLLQVIDNLDRALQYAKADTDPNLMSGLKMVAQQFIATLGKQGVALIPAIDHAFNPDLHESVGQMASDKPVGSIVQEVQKGYTLHGRLLRASRVMLSSGPATN
jgi:molecular chaperone GrpE